MGPASEVKDVLQCMSEKGWGDTGFDNTLFDDQLGLVECLFLMPDKITLDYGGALVLDLYGFNFTTIMRKGRFLVNQASQKTQCFIHANGLCSGGTLNPDTIGTGKLVCDPPSLPVVSDNWKFATA